MRSKESRRVYLDADKYDGLITPITADIIPCKHLEVAEVHVKNTKVGLAAYPYRDITSAEVGASNPSVIGHSLIANGADQLNQYAADFLFGTNPIRVVTNPTGIA